MEDPRDRKWFITIATIVNSSMYRWDKLLNGDLLIRPRWLCCFWFMVDIKLDSGVYKSANTNGGHQHVQIDCHSFFFCESDGPTQMEQMIRSVSPNPLAIFMMQRGSIWYMWFANQDFSISFFFSGYPSSDQRITQETSTEKTPKCYGSNRWVHRKMVTRSRGTPSHFFLVT